MRFNRNILGCKVNDEEDDILKYDDLIETYWDVKEGIPRRARATYRFNRNILGCKDR